MKADINNYNPNANGTADDSAIIQQAIDAVYLSGGGVVELDAKTYALSNTLVLKSGVQLIGRGWNTILKVIAPVRAIKTVGASISPTYNINISNLTIDGNKANVAVQGAGEGDEGSQSLVDFDMVRDSSLINVKMENSISNGLYANNGCENILVDGVHAYNNGKNGILSGGRGIVFGISPKYFRIVNSYIANNLYQGILIQAEGGDNATNFIISNNIIYENGSRGIDIGDNDISTLVNYNIYITQAIISNNIITNNASSGIRLLENTLKNQYGAIGVIEGLIIENNLIRANGEHGIHLTNSETQGRLLVNTIRNNSIIKNGVYGINIANSGCERTLISGNYLKENVLGTINDAGAATTIANNYL